MPLPRRRSRRAWLGPALGGLVALAGCQGLPTSRPAPTPPRVEPPPAPSPATVPPEAAAIAPAPRPEPPADLPPLPTATADAPAPPPVAPEALRGAEALARAALVEDVPATPVAEPSRPLPDRQLFLAEVHPPAASGASEVAKTEPPEADPPLPEPSHEAPEPTPTEPAVATSPAPKPKPAAAPAPSVVAEPSPAKAEAGAESRGVADPPPAEPALAITELAVCRRVRGFGDVERWGATGPRPGQAVLLYCALEGVRSEPDGDGVRSRVGATVELLPTAGGSPLWARQLTVAEDRGAAARRDFFVGYRVVLPGATPAGPYRLRLRIRDLLAGREAERTIPVILAR